MAAGTSRRRGAALEEAILDAAWAELIEHGYADMTLEAVAKRAGTSRPVLARRWPSRTRLATAVLARYLAQNPVDVPDLGSVGAEMRLFLRKLSDRARPDLLRLFFDMSGDPNGGEVQSRGGEGRAHEQPPRPPHPRPRHGAGRTRPGPPHAARHRAADRTWRATRC